MTFFEREKPDPKMAIKSLHEDKPEVCHISELLPQHPFMMTVVAPRKSGKTFMVVDMIKDNSKFRGFFDFIFVWSRSIKADSKWKNLQLPSFSTFDHWDPVAAEKIFNTIIALHSRYPKKDCPKTLFVWDDMASSNVSSPHTQGLLERVATTGRHFGVSAIFITQAYMRLSPTVRTNTTNMCVFRIRNAQEFSRISEENREALDKDEFFNLYNEVTSKPFTFLHVNNQQGDPCLRFSSCWNERIKIPSLATIKEEEVEEKKKKKTRTK